MQVHKFHLIFLLILASLKMKPQCRKALYQIKLYWLEV